MKTMNADMKRQVELVKAHRDLFAKIEHLERENDTLRARVTELEGALREISERLDVCLMAKVIAKAALNREKK